MKHFKMFGLLAVAAAALMAFAGVASASIAKSGGANYTSTVTAESSNSSLHGSFITVSCTGSHIQGKISSHGPGVTIHSPSSTISIRFEGCNYPVTVKKVGTLEVHTTTTPSAVITSSGSEIAIHTSVGECVFTTSGTSLGTVTGGNNATLDLDSAAIPRTGGSFFCGSSGEWTGNYTVKTPSNLTFH